MAEGTIPPQATGAVDELRSRAGELGTELAWYADMTKKAFRGLNLSAVLGVFSGGLAVRTDQEIVIAPWERLEFLSRKHEVPFGTAKNRENELVFAVSGHGRLSISHNRGKDNPGGPLEPVSELAEQTYGRWVTAQALAAVAAGESFAFGEVVVKPTWVQLGKKTVTITDEATVEVSPVDGSVEVKVGDVSHKYDSTKVNSPAALRTVLAAIGKGRPAKAAPPNGALDLRPDNTIAGELRRTARAAAEQAGLGEEVRWFATISRIRKQTYVLGVFTDGYALAKEGGEPDIVSWSTGRVGPMWVDGHTGPAFRISVTDDRLREFGSTRPFPVKEAQVPILYRALNASFAGYCHRELRTGLAQEGKVTVDKITIDRHGLSKTVRNKEIRVNFADVAWLTENHKVAPGIIPNVSLVVREICAAPVGLTVQYGDVPHLPALSAVVRGLIAQT